MSGFVHFVPLLTHVYNGDKGNSKVTEVGVRSRDGHGIGIKFVLEESLGGV